MTPEPLLLQAVEQPHGYRRYLDNYGEAENRIELDRPRRWVASVTPMDGRVELSVKEIDLQRIVDQADIKRRRRSRATSRDEMAEGSEERSAYRARKAVRLLVQRLRCDHMVTFTTRATLTVPALLVRFRRFVEYLQRATGQRMKYVAVPEPHKTGDHWHLHVAVPGFFDLSKANPIWWALCASDDSSHQRNGAINVKRFLCRYHSDDPIGTIAAYISKYMTKSAGAAEVNKKKYWSTRLPKLEVDRRVLEAKNIDEAFKEVTDAYGLDAVDIAMTHQGCLFVLPEDRGFWLRILPTMKCAPPF